jgi:WD40 repeat protein
VLRGHEGGVTAVGISPDNHWLVTGSSDGAARLWDLRAEDPAANPVVLRGYEWVTAAGFFQECHFANYLAQLFARYLA